MKIAVVMKIIEVEICVNVSVVDVGLNSVVTEVKDFFNPNYVFKDELVDFFAVVKPKAYAAHVQSSGHFLESEMTLSV